MTPGSQTSTYQFLWSTQKLSWSCDEYVPRYELLNLTESEGGCAQNVLVQSLHLRRFFFGLAYLSTLTSRPWWRTAFCNAEVKFNSQRHIKKKKNTEKEWFSSLRCQKGQWKHNFFTKSYTYRYSRRIKMGFMLEKARSDVVLSFLSVYTSFQWIV